MTDFASLDLKPELIQAIEGIGYTQPTPIQAQTIPLLLEGHDVIGCAQTGTGKTAAFSIPVIQSLEGGGTHPQALIITPTRELAEQIYQNLVDYTRYLPAIRSVVVYGGVPSRTQESLLKKGCDILIATPGRLLDHLNQSIVRLYDVKYLILDEADRMLDMGFIPDIENIMTYVPRKRQTLLFSATMPPAIEKLARNITKPDAEMIVAGNRSSTSDSVTQVIYRVDQRNKLNLLTDLLKRPEMTSTIIFSRTKVGCSNLARHLIQSGIAAAPIHSNLTQGQRQSSMDGFKRGDYTVLVATDIAARGIDVDNVSHVINFDTPTHAEDYVHRIGRTGRASAKGEAYTFTAPEEMKYLKQIEKFIGRSLELMDPPGGAKRSERSEAAPRERESNRDSGRENGRESSRGGRREATRSEQRAPQTRENGRRDERAARPQRETRPERSARPQRREDAPVMQNSRPERVRPSAAREQRPEGRPAPRPVSSGTKRVMVASFEIGRPASKPETPPAPAKAAAAAKPAARMAPPPQAPVAPAAPAAVQREATPAPKTPSVMPTRSARKAPPAQRVEPETAPVRARRATPAPEAAPAPAKRTRRASAGAEATPKAKAAPKAKASPKAAAKPVAKPAAKPAAAAAPKAEPASRSSRSKSGAGGVVRSTRRRPTPRPQDDVEYLDEV
ncbi:MAG: DEAD/DEAH box helicase [Candidatus Sericytochromatia bacterium]